MRTLKLKSSGSPLGEFRSIASSDLRVLYPLALGEDQVAGRKEQGEGASDPQIPYLEPE
jgi:hypothetical protein